MRFLATVIAATALMSVGSISCFAKDDSGAFVTSSIEVNAAPKNVFEAIKKHRLVTPGRKMISYKNGQAVMEEQFENLPVIGNADVTYIEEEHPMEIDYKMIRSDKMKEFEGSWKLSSIDGGKHTLLQLSAKTDAGVHVPFSGTITKNNTRKHSEKRLAEIKRLAETVI